MKKQTTFIIALVTSQFAFSQVGVNNTSPQATLDVTAKTTNGSKPEGFIAPRLTGDQIKSADTRYGTAQTGTIIYATSAVSSPVVGSKTEFITAAGYYFYDGSKWQKLSGSGSGGGYLGSTSVTLNGTSFERAALTGDVTASANSNATTVAKIQGKSVASTAPTNGQVLKYNTTTSAWEPSSDAGLTSEVDGVVGNEVTSATTNGGLSVSGSGTAASPYTLGLPTTGVTSGQIMKWDGTKWALASDTDTNTTYTGSTSVTLNGTSFERPALTGDVTASANSNATTVAKIQGKSVSTTAPTNGQVLKYNTTTSAWEPAADTDTNTTYTAGGGLTLTGTAFSANDATTTAKGIVQLAGDLGGTSGSPTVTKIQNKSVASTAPTNGQVLKYNTTTSAWEPAADVGTTYTGSTSVTLNGTSFERPALTGDVTASANSNATTVAKIQGKSVASTAPTNGQVLKYNTTTSSWEPAADTDTNTTYTAGGGLTLTGTAFSANDATTTAKGIVQLAGDLGGTSGSPTVTKIQNKSVASTAPTNGQVLKYNTTTSAWEPAADVGTTYTGSTSVTLNGTSFERPALTGDVTASANSNATTVAKIQGKSVSTTAPTNGQVLKYNTTTSAWEPAADTDTNTTYTGSTSVTLNGTSFERPALTGDVTASANSNATTVAKIQGKSVSSTAPTNGQVLKYNTTTSSWEPSSDAGLTSEVDGIIGNEVTSATTNGGLSVSGSGTAASPYTLGLPTTGVTSGQIMKWDGTKWALASDTDTNTTYTGSTSVTLNGTSFERPALTGDVTASANSNATTVAKIQGKSVSTTAPTNGQVLKYNTATSAWEPAADVGTTYTGSTSVTLNGTSFERPALTGDVTASANSNATTVAKIQGKSVSTTAPTNGQVLKYNTTTSAWEPAADVGTTYTGSTSVTLNGTAFERPALTGDVTASANSNATTVAKIQGKSVSTTAPTNGQVLKYNTTTSAWEPSSDAGLTSEVDGIIGNEVTSATTNGGLSVSGSGTASSPYTLGLPTTGVTTGQIMKWDGTKWALASDTDTNTTYTGSTSVTLNGTAFERPALTGDVTASANSNATTVAKIQGKSVSTTAPTNGQVLKYNTTTSAWEPAADTDTNTTYTGSTSVTLNGTAFERPALTGDVTASANSNATTVAKIQGKSVASTAPTNGQVLKYNTATSAWEPAADVGTTYTGSTSVTLNGTSFERPALTGDVTASANSNATTVAKIQGKSVSTTAPTNGQVLKYNTTTSAWEPAADTDTNTTYTGSTSVTLNGTAFERPALTGDVTASANSNATTVAKIQGKSVSTTAPTNGQVLKYNTTTSAWEPAADTDTNTTYTGSTSVTLNGTSFERPALTGDVTASANSNATTVAKIQGKSVSTTAPTNGQVLKYNTTTSAWEPAADVGTTYTGSTSVTLNGTSFERPALTGDVTASANSNATTVAKIQGTAVSSSAPTTAGESLIYNGTSWGPSSNTLTVSPEVTTGTYTVKATDFFLRLNPTAAIIYINLPSTGIPVGKVIHIVNKGNKQANFLWDNVAPSGTLFYDQARPAVLGGGYSGTLVYLGGTGQGAWSFVVTY